MWYWGRLRMVNLTLSDLILLVLVKIPTVAVDVLKHNDHPVFLLSRLLAEVDALRFHGVIVAPEVVTLQEQEYPAAALVANEAFLSLVRSTGQEKIAIAFRIWRYNDPALTGLLRVFNQRKAQLVCVILNCAVIVVDYDGHITHASFLRSHFCSIRY